MHSCANRNREAGRSVNEWDLVRHLPGRPQPLLGYWDDSSPETLSQEISLAQTYGVDGFIMNLYHNGSWAELLKPVDAFCQEAAGGEVGFAFNWCYRMPRRIMPVPLNYEKKKTAHLIHAVVEENRNIHTDLTPAAISNLMNFCRPYFLHNRYIRVNNKHYFSLYHVTGLLRQYGADGLEALLSSIRAAARSYGVELHLVGVLSVTPEDEVHNGEIRAAGFDALTAYCALADFKEGAYHQDYATLYPKRVQEWAACKGVYKKTFYPCLAAGWDASARGESGYNPSLHGLVFPWAPVVKNDTPANFRAYLGEALDYCEREEEAVLLLGPWNEWSEGCYLLPDSRYGFGRLEAIREAKENFVNDQLKRRQHV